MSGPVVVFAVYVISCVCFSGVFSAPTQPMQRSVIVSMETGRFVTLGSNGEVTANGDRGLFESQFMIHYLDTNRIQIQAENLEKVIYLIVRDGMFTAGPANRDNSIFEVERQADGYSVALRHASQDGNKEEDCYLGFNSAEGKPTCYLSADTAATRFFIVH